MKGITGLVAAVLLSGVAVSARAQSELKTYVDRCRAEVGFTTSEVKPLDCNDGNNFVFGGLSPENDIVVHQRVNQNVDMVAACRWGDGSPSGTSYKNFLSLELLIHNRQNGATCFFAAKETYTGPDPRKPVSGKIVAITNFTTTHPNADDYWLKPSEMNSKLLFSRAKPGDPNYKEKLQCVRCHSQGPYIASKRIGIYLSNLGLLNDGHHTYSDFAAPNHYYVVGSGPHDSPDPGHPLGNWNQLIFQSNTTDGCSNTCHVLAKSTASGGFTPIGDLSSTVDPRTILLPSIKTDIEELDGNGMDPWEDDSPYHYTSFDQPSSDAVEVETFTAAKTKYPVTLYCSAPTWAEALPTNTEAPFSTQAISQIPNKLRSFNLRDGLVCLNADQTNGVNCYDYQVWYRCPTMGAPSRADWLSWVGPYNEDKIYTDDGDHEERSKSFNKAKAACGNKDPVALKADALYNNIPVVTATAPPDRLAQFNYAGLVCKNSDQGSGQSCKNYTVRYRGCKPSSQARLARMVNVWTSSTFTNRLLTTTANSDGAETRGQGNNFQYSSQDWMIENVPGGSTVRLFDVWSGKYLTASSNTDQAKVVVKNSDLAQMRQQWVKETISGSYEVRFRNVGSGRYLTMGSTTGDPYFAPIISQTLSNQNWASQRWIVQ